MSLKTVILAGGYGTRLSEETAVRPKPMVEIGEQPDPLAHHEDLRGPRRRRLRDLPAATRARDQGLLRELLPAHVGRHGRPRRRTSCSCETHGVEPWRVHARRHRRRDDDRRPAEAGRAPRRRRDVLLHLRRRRHRPRHDEAARVPPRRGRARDADRDPAAGPLRRARRSTTTRRRSSASARSPRATAAGSTAASSCSSPRCSTTSTATTRSGSASRSSAWPSEGGWRPTATTASGSTWTRCATRWCSRSSGRPAAPPWKTLVEPAAGLPLLRRAARAGRSPTSACSPLANSYLRAERLDAGRSRSTRCTRLRLRRVLPRAAAGVRDARGDLQRLRLLLVVLGRAGSSTPQRYVEAMVERFGLGAGRARSSRSPATTATCCSTSSSAASRCSASSRRRTSPTARDRAGDPDAGRVLRHARPRRRCADEGIAADLLLGNNVLAHVPDLNDFVAGMSDAARAGRRRHDGVPAPAAADRAQRVRHDLPRALLVLLAPRRASRSSPRTGCGSSTSRSCRTHGGSLRIYARHAGDADAAGRERGRGAAGDASARPGSTGSRRYGAFARAGARDASATCSSS